MEFTTAAQNLVLVGGTGTEKRTWLLPLVLQAYSITIKRCDSEAAIDLANSLEQEKSTGKQGRLALRLLQSYDYFWCMSGEESGVTCW